MKSSELTRGSLPVGTIFVADYGLLGLSGNFTVLASMSVLMGVTTFYFLPNMNKYINVVVLRQTVSFLTIDCFSATNMEEGSEGRQINSQERIIWNFWEMINATISYMFWDQYAEKM